MDKLPKYLTILLFALIPSTTFGQAEDLSVKVRKSNIRFGIGLMHVRMIDEGYTDSKLLFRGTNALFSLAYGRESDRYIFNFSLSGSIGKVSSASGDLPTNYYYLEPALKYERNIHEFKALGKENKLFAGVLISSFNQGIENEKVINNVSIFSLHGLYFNFVDRLDLNERTYFQLSYSMPAVVFQNRLLWNGGASVFTRRDTENIPKLLIDHGKFSYFNLSSNIQLGVDYVMKTGKTTHLKIGYKFFYASSQTEAPLHFYFNELILELKIAL